MPFRHTVACYVWWGLADRTRRTYQITIKGYILHCAIHDKTPFPATFKTLAIWVADMGEKRILPKSIKLYLTGVRLFQVDIGATKGELEVFHHPTLERIIQDIRRLRGDSKVRERLPVTRPILLKILSLFDTATRTGATLHAAFCLAFAGFLRIGEFTWSKAD